MAYRRIENAVQQILLDFGLAKLPIPVEEVAEKLGVKIKQYDLGEDVSGVLAINKGIGTIGVRQNDPLVRQRFSIAHELGHYVLHRGRSDLFIDKEYKILFRNSKSSTGEVQQEREANAFAAALLMPEMILKDDVLDFDLSDEYAIRNLAKRYHVSELAMTFRIANLNLA